VNKVFLVVGNIIQGEVDRNRLPNFIDPWGIGMVLWRHCFSICSDIAINVATMTDTNLPSLIRICIGVAKLCQEHLAFELGRHAGPI